jgi:hypothetical protein
MEEGKAILCLLNIESKNVCSAFSVTEKRTHDKRIVSREIDSPLLLVSQELSSYFSLDSIASVANNAWKKLRDKLIIYQN